MGRDKRNEQRQPQFTKWIRAHRLLPAWKALSFPARDAYFHLRVRCFAEAKNSHNNNGEVYRSLRKLAEDMGCSVKTAGAALADLQAKGWIVCTNPWQRGTDGTGKTATFRLTMLPAGKREATREPERWAVGHDYPVTVYQTYLPKPRQGRARNLEIQNPPPHSGTPPCPIRAQLRAVQS
ncbi:helix-turn-helix domain-containing protein [Aquicoccus sp. SU-CL01552]|uniref:helix-turn-helix domain-containing protein n=1 Tax=Aquicoccus sp. SU-CL01552 TaxID=3127656 RepID=UPI003102F3B5